MKLILNTSTLEVAHIDVITAEKGILNTYADETAFWSSQAPVATQDMEPSGSYDELTDRALILLGSGWEIVERD
jgi:hypothetical protein